VIMWPDSDEYSDYNSWRLAGGTPENFMCDIVGSAVQPQCEVECYYDTRTV